MAQSPEAPACHPGTPSNATSIRKLITPSQGLPWTLDTGHIVGIIGLHIPMLDYVLWKITYLISLSFPISNMSLVHTKHSTNIC